MTQLKALVIIGLFYASFTVINLISQEVRLQNYQSRLDVDIKRVSQEQQELQNQIRYYQTRTGVEEVARKHLGYYRKDEIPIRVIQSKHSSQ